MGLPRRFALPPAAIVTLAGLTAAAVGIAATPAAALAPTEPTATAVLVLRPTSEAALASLATAHGLTATARAARLAALVPDAARHRQTTAAAQALGLHVTAGGDWTIRVEAPRHVLAALFGAAPKTALAAAYPAVPEALRQYVVAALPGSGKVARPLATTAPTPRTGSDFRTAYAAPAVSQPGAGFTIATVQLSGWQSRDLSTYATAAGLPAPSYRAVSVDGGSTSVPDGSGGDQEVALDQESLLSTAPYAAQRAYFARNDDGGQGFIDAIHRAGQDAAANHIAALSLSWGGCEPSDGGGWFAAMNQALEFTLAAGVTVFAASGDSGSFDCLGELSGSVQYQPAVDFPASSPYVVAVGGTSLPDPVNPTTAKSWLDSGGGESVVTPLPAWQYAVRGHSKHGGRLLPDISSDADPGTGFRVFDSVLPKGERWQVIGGTSLAAPTQAALLVDALGPAGWSTGVGDVHQALYTAGAAAFTDITVDQAADGNGSYRSGPGYDEVTGLGTPRWTALLASLGTFVLPASVPTRSVSVSIKPTLPIGLLTPYRAWSAPVVGASATCDLATNTTPPTSVTLPAGAADGRYTVSIAGVDGSSANAGTGSCHVVSTQVLLDRAAPRVSASLRPWGSTSGRASWSSTDGSTSSGLSRYVVTIKTAAGTLWSASTTSTSYTFNALPQRAYTMSVTAYDRAGNAGSAGASLFDNGNFSYGTAWKTTTSTYAYRRTILTSTARGAKASITATGRSFVIYVTTGRGGGEFAVYDGARYLKTVNTYASSTHYRVAVTLLSATTSGRHTLNVRNLHRHSSGSQGYSVPIDGLALS